MADENDNESGAEIEGGTLVTPMGSIELSAEEAQAIAEAKKEADAAKKRKVRELVNLLIDKREGCIRARRHIERRWIDDKRQLDGEGRLLNTKEFPSQTNNDRLAPPRAHLTRARTDIWESRMIDLLAPTSDPTWDLRPLCDEGIQAAPKHPQVQPETDEDAARMAIHEDQAERARRMRLVIQDQLAACNAQKAIRKMCKDACHMGTGLVMGPMNGIRIQRKYTGDSNSPIRVAIEESIIPEIREADPWCFYPDMVPTAEKAEYAFYVHWMSQTDLHQFMEFPGVDKEACYEVMDEKPQYGEVEESIRERNEHSGEMEDIANRHAVWRYTGIVDQKYLEALNIDDKVDGMVSADIWFCNSHILKAKVTQLSAVKDFRIPYYVFSPFPVDETMFGGSIPYLCRDSQRIADSALLISLSNASVSAGPQIFMRKGKFTPADGKWSIRGPKSWWVNDDQTPVDELMHVVQIESNANESMQIFDVAKQLMDEELNTAQWASPDTSEETETASGLAMLMNARTILQRRVCATADDEVFRPLIERFVLWNLLYNKREEIKGNYDVLPLCQSVRLVKDIQIQQKLFVVSNLAQNPMFQGMFNQYDMLKDIMRDMDVQVDNWLVPKDQWLKAQQQQAQSPQAQQAQQLQAAQLQLTTERVKTEQAKQTKFFNESQTQGQAQADTSGQQVSADAVLKHQQFLIGNDVKMREANSQIMQNHESNQTKLAIAAMQHHSNQQAAQQAMQSDARRERTDLLKTGVNARLQLHKIETDKQIKAQKPPTPTNNFNPKK